MIAWKIPDVCGVHVPQMVALTLEQGCESDDGRSRVWGGPPPEPCRTSRLSGRVAAPCNPRLCVRISDMVSPRPGQHS
jgi:hypothetical protein